VLRDAHRRGATLMMSTHDVGLGLTLCTNAVVLVRGRIAWQGPVDDSDVAGFEARYRALTHRSDPQPTAMPASP